MGDESLWDGANSLGSGGSQLHGDHRGVEISRASQMANAAGSATRITFIVRLHGFVFMLHHVVIHHVFVRHRHHLSRLMAFALLQLHRKRSRQCATAREW